MDGHLKEARNYYRAVSRREAYPSWSSEFVLDWLSILRVPGHEGRIPELPRGAACPRCGTDAGARGNNGYRTTIPGGEHVHCSCGNQWVVFDRKH